MTRTRSFALLLCVVCTLAAPAALAIERIEPQHILVLATSDAGDEERATPSQMPAAAADLISPLEVDSASSTNPGGHMHFKNGREATAGDVVVFDGGKYNDSPKVGVLHSLIPGADSCNGRLTQINPSDPLITVGECLHIDDVRAATIPDRTKGTAEAHLPLGSGG